MQQVINWVENGQALAVLDASGSINGQAVTRPLCPYPDPDAVYTGGGPQRGHQLHLQQPTTVHQPVYLERAARPAGMSAAMR
jgi:hypothetical protein